MTKPIIGLTVESATRLFTARKIGGVDFDGSKNISLPGVDSEGNQNTTGRAGSATKLTTSRTINGTAFDGTANITTENWGKSRDITIGGTKKSVNGAANLEWTLAEIGVGSVGRLNTNGSDEHFLRGDGKWIELGSSLMAVMKVPEDDLDKATKPGIYHWTEGVANTPTTYGSALVLAWNGTGVATAEQLVMKSGKMWIRGKSNEASAWTAWKEMGAGGASTWAELTGKPSTFPPSAHTHAIGDITGLQGAIDGKVNVAGNQTISGTKDFNGILRATATSNATSATTGSLRSAGGLGVALDIFAGGNITGYSDIRKKTDIEHIHDALDLVLKTRGVYYTRKDTGKKELGYIAQEMLEVIPRVVGGDPTSGLGISYGNLTAVISEAVKTLYNDYIIPYESRISYLENIIIELQYKMEQLLKEK